jgi:hypothetical protein
MPLIEFWQANPTTVLGMSLPTILRMAIDPDPSLKDGSEGSKAFRQFLGEIESTKLASYATFCLENAFPDSGQVLQDVVNEIGKRLGFAVENGRYRGVRNDIGYDGIWAANGSSLVIEVKTTDAYAISLDVIANYRDRLVEAGRIPKDTPILIVIGRKDTSSLEAQVRGSRHAWSMRIVGIDALIKLMEVNLNSISEAVTERIHTILRPLEYTRIDQIVDVVFTTAEDKEQQLEEVEPDRVVAELEQGRRVQQRTPREEINAKKAEAISRAGVREGVMLQRRRHSLYADPSDTVRAVVLTSKRYDDEGYWYAYHEEPQRRFLSEAKKGLLVLSMMDKDFAFAIPFEVLDPHWDQLYRTVTESGRVYKHLLTYEAQGKFSLRIRGVDHQLDMEPYRI